MKVKKPDGTLHRHNKMTEAAWQEILDRLCEGENLTQICRDENLPSRPQVYWWLNRDKDMAAQYARAKEAGMEAWEDELLRIADDPDGDYQRDRLRIDTRKFLMMKIKPQKYADVHRNVHVGGGDDDKPIKHAVITFKAATDD